MCRKLGKGHPNYTNREQNRRQPDGKIRRAVSGVPINRIYGHNAINAYCDLRDKLFDDTQLHYGGEFVPESLLTVAKQKRLDRMGNLQCYMTAARPSFGPGWYARKQAHLRRNHVTVVKA